LFTLLLYCSFQGIVEVLLRNPKNSQLLYRPNRAGETPYNIDMNHQKTILGQIFGASKENKDSCKSRKSILYIYCLSCFQILFLWLYEQLLNLLSSDQCYLLISLMYLFLGRLNTNEDNENMLGYDLYSSALADILSEPSLSMPITVGLYAKWGSGKSFLLNKLRGMYLAIYIAINKKSLNTIAFQLYRTYLGFLIIVLLLLFKMNEMITFCTV